MNRHFLQYLAAGLFLLFIISCAVSEVKETTKAPAAPKPGDCASCHEDKEVIPKSHVDTKNMTGDACTACHGAELKKKIPLGHIHQLEGISCKGCHEDPASAQPVDSAACKTCHNDMKALYNATSEMELNPHFSPHDGKISDCNKCHHQHKESVNFCTGCHKK